MQTRRSGAPVSVLLDSAGWVLYTCLDVLATLSPGRSESYRGSRNNWSRRVVGDVDSTGGRVVEAALTG